MSDVHEEEALLLTAEAVKTICEWAPAIEVEEINPETQERYPALNVQCGEDVKRASLDDWVIKNKDGTFDVKKPNEYIRWITALH